MATTDNQPRAGGEPRTFPCHRCGQLVYRNKRKKALFAVGDTTPDCWLDGIQGTHQAPPLKPWENVTIWVVGIAIVLGLTYCYHVSAEQVDRDQERYEECFTQRWTPQHTDEDERNLRRYCRETVRSGNWDA